MVLHRVGSTSPCRSEAGFGLELYAITALRSIRQADDGWNAARLHATSRNEFTGEIILRIKNFTKAGRKPRLFYFAALPKQRINIFMKQFTAIIHQGEPGEGGFWATCLEVPGANGQGETKAECLLDLTEAVKLLLETEREEVFRLDPKAETTELLLA
jgi:predicted RNase H-like HicB family nuclease